MPEKVLGLDIREDSITALQLKSELKGYQITACARASIKEDGRLESALTELSGQMDLSSDLCFASIPARYASYRNLNMPFSESKKIKQTLGFEIETMLPYPVEDMVLDFVIIALHYMLFGVLNSWAGFTVACRGTIVAGVLFVLSSYLLNYLGKKRAP